MSQDFHFGNAQQPAAPQQYGPPQGYQPPQFQQATPQQQGRGFAENLGLGEFLNQPAGAGQGLSWDRIGRTYDVVFPREVSDNDVRQQTNPQSGEPQYYNDGRPKTVLVVPIVVHGSYLADNAGALQTDNNGTPTDPENEASWWVRGVAFTELQRAMSAAGAPNPGIVEGGAKARISYVRDKPNGRGMSPTKVISVQYLRPDGAASSAPAATSAPAAPATSAPQPHQPAGQGELTQSQSALFADLGGTQQ